MKEIKILPHTIIALVAQPGMGAFTFVENNIIPVLKAHKVPYHCGDFRELDFSIAEYPAKAEVIISNAFTKESFDELVLMAHANNFQLKVLVFNENLTLNGTEYIAVNVLDKYLVVYEKDLNVVCNFNEPNYAVIGDIHGSYDTFIKMLKDDKGMSIKDGKITITDPSKYVKHILVGDYIDKGSYKGIRKMIEFIYDNLEHFIVVIGNHEYWVAEYLKGNIKPSESNTALIGKYFSTAVLLLHDKELREKFFKIFNSSFSCVETDLAIITHAPCHTKYLGKEDAISRKFMRNMAYPKNADYANDEEYLEARDRFFSFIKDEANILDKYHIFGHTMIPEIFKHENKICLDTGCVVGGKLSVALFRGGELEFKQYDSTLPALKERLLPYFI